MGLEIPDQDEFWGDVNRIGVCDWGCGREELLYGICLDGRLYQVCASCLSELRERFEEEEDYADEELISF